MVRLLACLLVAVFLAAPARAQSRSLLIDRENKWVHKDKLVKDDGKGGTGVTGDQTVGTAQLGEMFVGYKIKDAVEQIRSLVK